MTRYATDHEHDTLLQDTMVTILLMLLLALIIIGEHKHDKLERRVAAVEEAAK